VKLSGVTARFLRTPVYDAYTSAQVCKGQLEIYDFAVRDSLTGGRRTVTVPAATTVPARRVVTVHSTKYLVGDSIEDSRGTSVLKEHWVLHPVDDLASVGTSADIIAGTGTQMYAALSWRKLQKEEEISSEFFNLYNLYVAKGEFADRDYVISLKGNYYRVASIEETTGGFQVFVCYELGVNALQPIVYESQISFDRVSEQYSFDTQNVQAFVERYQTTYRYLNKEDEKYRAGDVIVTVSKADVSTAKTGDRVTVGTFTYTVLAVYDDFQGAWELHCRLM